MRGFKQQEAIYERKPTYQKLLSGTGKITGQQTTRLQTNALAMHNIV